MSYYILIWAFIILVFLLAVWPKKKQRDFGPEYHIVEGKSVVPHSIGEYYAKYYKKPKAKASKKPKSKMDEIIDEAKDPYHTQYGTYQSPCGTCTSSCAPGCSIAF